MRIANIKPLYLLILIIIPNISRSQSKDFKRHEIEVNYSYITTDRFINNFYDALFWMDDNDDKYLIRNSMTSPGAVFLSYRFNVLKKMSLGLTCGFEMFSGDIVNTHSVNFGKTKKMYLTTALECKYKYTEKKILSFYGFLGFGYSFLFTKDDFSVDVQGMKFVNSLKSHINGQITPIGIRVGKTFGGYLELGVGYKGLITAGLSINL
jgi:hypothetical protein